MIMISQEETIRSIMSFFVVGMFRLSRRESKSAILVGFMDIARLIIHVQEVEEDNMIDKEFRNKRVKKLGNEFE